jgi:hypothetical protein
VPAQSLKKVQQLEEVSIFRWPARIESWLENHRLGAGFGDAHSSIPAPPQIWALCRMSCFSHSPSRRCHAQGAGLETSAGWKTLFRNKLFAADNFAQPKRRAVHTALLISWPPLGFPPELRGGLWKRHFIAPLLTLSVACLRGASVARTCSFAATPHAAAAK